MPNHVPFLAAAAIAALVAVAAPAHAQVLRPASPALPGASVPRGFTAAPVPDRTAPDIEPSDRAGTRTSLDAGPLNGTPFSGLPSSQLGGSALGPATRDTGERPTEIPNLAK